jgi:hypothetical protein
LFKQTTFFPSQDVPVYMSEFDDDTVGSCPNTFTAEYDIKMEDDREDRLSVSKTNLVAIFIRNYIPVSLPSV